MPHLFIGRMALLMVGLTLLISKGNHFPLLLKSCNSSRGPQRGW